MPKAARREEKDKFNEELSNVLSNTPDSDLFVLLGDFNAHIGSRDAAQELLSFLTPIKLPLVTRGFKRRTFI